MFALCDGESYLTLVFPDGTVDAVEADPVIGYTASATEGHRVRDSQGNGAVSPDQFPVAVSIP